MGIPFSIDIALRWSAGGSIYRFLSHAKHSTPLECGRVGIPFSILGLASTIALRWSAGGWVYRFLFSLRSNSTPLECGIFLRVP